MSNTAKVLVVDDDPASAMALHKILEEEGFEALSVHGGQEALDVISDFRPDLVMLDIVMPGMTGFDVIERLRDDEATVFLPVIFVTGLDDRGTLDQIFQAGGADYIIKPVSRIEVGVRASFHVERKRLHDENEALMGLNSLIVKRINRILGELPLLETISTIKDEIAESSGSMFDVLERVRERLQDTQHAVNDAEFALQFTDRVSQQVNELAKLVGRLHGAADSSGDGQALLEKLDGASTDSVMQDTDREGLDQLLKSLNI